MKIKYLLIVVVLIYSSCFTTARKQKKPLNNVYTIEKMTYDSSLNGKHKISGIIFNTFFVDPRPIHNVLIQPSYESKNYWTNLNGEFQIITTNDSLRINIYERRTKEIHTEMFKFDNYNSIQIKCSFYVPIIYD